jgi:hypothetical protein
MKRIRTDFAADGLGVAGKNLSFLTEPAFVAAWAKVSRLALEGCLGNAPDIRWRAHVAVWCASNALRVEGDFVECGVHTGILAGAVCEMLGFATVPKTYWLFDTWSGIPVETLSGEEREHAEQLNAGIYSIDIYAFAKRNFEPYPNVKLVRGILPGSLEHAAIEKIAYLSVDLNSAVAEQGIIERLWPIISAGGMILLDDYGFQGFERQHDMWNSFAQRVDRRILTIPTGQGLLIK